MIVVTSLFMWRDVMGAIHYVKKRWLVKQGNQVSLGYFYDMMLLLTNLDTRNGKRTNADSHLDLILYTTNPTRIAAPTPSTLPSFICSHLLSTTIDISLLLLFPG